MEPACQGRPRLPGELPQIAVTCPAKKVAKALGLQVGVVGLARTLGAAGYLKRNPAFPAAPATG